MQFTFLYTRLAVYAWLIEFFWTNFMISLAEPEPEPEPDPTYYIGRVWGQAFVQVPPNV